MEGFLGAACGATLSQRSGPRESETILREFPSLTEDDVRAVLAFESAGPAALASDVDPSGPPNAALSYDSEGVDRSLIRWMLRLTPRQRLDHLQGMIDLARLARRGPNGHR